MWLLVGAAALTSEAIVADVPTAWSFRTERACLEEAMFLERLGHAPWYRCDPKTVPAAGDEYPS